LSALVLSHSKNAPTKACAMPVPRSRGSISISAIHQLPPSGQPRSVAISPTIRSSPSKGRA
jgi:hypothetical protein